jgi:transcriptional regulator with XRE-family HTH domain
MWLELAPTPDYDEPTRQAIADDPVLVAALDAAAASRAPLSERLPTLRNRAGLAVHDVAGRLSQLFGLDDEQRAAAYLERIEHDELDERRLSRRLIDALATILGADVDQLTPSPAALSSGRAFFRAEENADVWIAEDIDVLSRAALSPAPSAPMDELDRLFLGGPNG